VKIYLPLPYHGPRQGRGKYIFTVGKGRARVIKIDGRAGKGN
jgi:hypothetical protein